MAQQYLTGSAQIVPPLAGGGIVQAQGKIPGSGALQPPADGLPGRQQIRQGDHAEVVPQRRTQHRGAGKCRGDPRHHCHLYLRVVPGQLQKGPRHTVDPRVSTAHQSGGPAAPGTLQRPAAPLQLLGHGGGEHLLFRVLGRYKIHIHPIAAQHLGFIQGAARLGGEAAAVPGTQPHYIHFTHSSISNPGKPAAGPPPW